MDRFINHAVSAMAKDSWFRIGNVLSRDQITAINVLMDQWIHDGLFKQAGIGRGAWHQSNDAIRGDLILWSDDVPECAMVKEIMNLVDDLRVRINRELFAGIDSFEGHFAVYPPGSFYKRHIDAFRDDDARTISMVLYLNQDWTEAEGGELLIEVPGGRDVKIAPTGGSLVLFDARRFPHEVLPAKRERRSFTGWFKVRKIKA